MPVRSTPPPEARSKSAAIVSGHRVDEIARHTIRWTSLAVLAASFLGAVMAFNGHWPTTWHFWTWEFWQQISIIAAGGGILLQSFCTLLEWSNRKRKFSPQYLGPLLLDIGSTYIGYAVLIVPVIQRALQRATLPAIAATIISHSAVVVFAWWIAYYPEQNLVEE